MRRLKGITINGEWLGNNVVINGMFRAICAISPYVMQEFIRLINSIEKLDEAVKINKFSFPDNNTIEIEFSNNSLNGLADLYFCMDNGVPKLLDTKLRFKNQFENTIEKDIEEKPLVVENAVGYNEEIPEPAEVQLEVTQQLESAPTDDVEELLHESKEEECSEKEDNPEPAEISENKVKPEFEIESDDSDDTKTPIIDDENVITKDAISSMVDEIISRASDIDARPIQIQLIQPAQSQAPQIQPIIIQTDSTADKVEENPVSANNEVSLKEEPDSAEESFDKLEDEIIEEETNEPVILETQECQEEREDPEKQEVQEDTELYSNDEIEEVVSEPVEDIDSSMPAAETEKIEADELVDDFVEESVIQNASEDLEVAEEPNDDLIPDNAVDAENSEEDIEECLSEFYDTEKTAEESVVDEKTKDNIAMQAMLAEMMLLKDELNKLKSEASEPVETVKPTVNEFFGDNEEYYNVDDEDADFKIMADGTRINASILDEDLFIAGNKLYRWGETLYLDE